MTSFHSPLFGEELASFAKDQGYLAHYSYSLRFFPLPLSPLADRLSKESSSGHRDHQGLADGKA